MSERQWRIIKLFMWAVLCKLYESELLDAKTFGALMEQDVRLNELITELRKEW